MNILAFLKLNSNWILLTVNSQHTETWLRLGINLTSSEKSKWVNTGTEVNMASFETTKLTFQVGP